MSERNDADGGRSEDATVWFRAERAQRLGSALSRMAHDLAAIERENLRLRRENAALHRRIEQLEAERATARRAP